MCKLTTRLPRSIQHVFRVNAGRADSNLLEQKESRFPSSYRHLLTPPGPPEKAPGPPHPSEAAGSEAWSPAACAPPGILPAPGCRSAGRRWSRRTGRSACPCSDQPEPVIKSRKESGGPTTHSVWTRSFIPRRLPAGLAALALAFASGACNPLGTVPVDAAAAPDASTPADALPAVDPCWPGLRALRRWAKEPMDRPRASGSSRRLDRHGPARGERIFLRGPAGRPQRALRATGRFVGSHGPAAGRDCQRRRRGVDGLGVSSSGAALAPPGRGAGHRCGL